MGRETEALALARGHIVTSRVDPVAPGADAKALTAAHNKTADVVIEFALPEGIEERIKLYTDLGLNAVIATTGWQDRKAAVQSLVMQSQIGVVYGSNFSVGANVFFEIVRRATRLFNRFPEYDTLAYELHHRRKKDSPSGTALSTADAILSQSLSKDKLVTEKLDRAIAANELHFASVRGGSIPGVHTVLFDSETDTVEITHNARSRGGFALGAVLAAEWICGKKGFFEFSDFMKEKLLA